MIQLLFKMLSERVASNNIKDRRFKAYKDNYEKKKEEFKVVKFFIIVRKTKSNKICRKETVRIKNQEESS